MKATAAAVLALAVARAASAPVDTTNQYLQTHDHTQYQKNSVFNPESQADNQRLRRFQRRLSDSIPANPFQHPSPYGNGALPVSEDQRDNGFGGRTLY